ncbi:MAG: hypothetical protein H0W73_18475 [Bacteroidetes bacterium]|nr:hypothetical protein [Bacteroidota bacterium]
MKLIYTFFLSVLFSLSTFAQVKSTCKIERIISTTPVGDDQNNLIVKFVGPTKQPVKSNVKMSVDDETVFPEMNEKGIYVDRIDLGTYKFTFSVPYWYDMIIEKLKVNKNEILSITVYFNAKEIGVK